MSSSRLLDSDHNTRKQEASLDAAVRDLVMESDMEEAELIDLAEKKSAEIETEKSAGK